MCDLKHGHVALQTIMYFVLLLFFSLKLSYVEPIENHGPYQIQWKQYKMCSNSPDSRPKKTFFLSTMREHKPHPIFQFNMTILAPTHFDEAKIVVHSIKEGRQVLIHNQKVDNPCKSYPLFKLLQVFLDLSKSCVIPMGSHIFDINFNELAKKFIGDQFFYGEYLAKVSLLSNKKILACVIIVSEFTKA